MNKLRFLTLRVVLIAALSFTETFNRFLSLLIRSKRIRTSRVMIKLEEKLFKLRCYVLLLVKKLLDEKKIKIKIMESSEEVSFINDESFAADN
ncbi:MAG: hypothetical protein ACI4GY_05340 [Acutalibacteraceae bacterium]